MKDINRLLNAPDKKSFDTECVNWPGIETFRKHAWDCQCGDPGCLRSCILKYASMFPHRDIFAQYLDEIVGIDSSDELQDYTDKFGERMTNPKKLN